MIAPPPPSVWMEFQERWHEFFLMTGTAAVTLAGLLFVAISMHLETLIHDTRAHLLALSRAILMSFIVVLTLSLMMLVPAQPLRPVAVEMMAAGLAFTVVTLRQMRAPTGTHHPEFPHSLLRRRLAPMLVGYAIIAATGFVLLMTHRPEYFASIIGALCMLLGNAAGASWDLLVRTAKIRRREAAEAERAR